MSPSAIDRSIDRLNKSVIAGDQERRRGDDVTTIQLSNSGVENAKFGFDLEKASAELGFRLPTAQVLEPETLSFGSEIKVFSQ